MARTKGAKVTRRPASEGCARCWRAIRVLRTFTLPQLCMTADVRRDNANHYVLSLALAGLVQKIRENQSGKAGSFAIWRLVRDPGPAAPIPCGHRKGLYDPNTGKTYGGSDDGNVKPA